MPTTTTRLKLKSWRGEVNVSNSVSQYTLILNSTVDMGGLGSCKVAELELDPATGIVYFWLAPSQPGGHSCRMFTIGSGSGEFLDG
jgi:hypothetical protein